jgi:hypothetical protein
MKILLVSIILFLFCSNYSQKKSDLIIGTWIVYQTESKDGNVLDSEEFLHQTFIYQKDNVVIHNNNLVNWSDTGHWDIKDETLFHANLGESLKPYGQIIKLDNNVLRVIQLTTPDSLQIIYRKISE